MHDMPRVTIVFGKVVDLNQDNESYLLSFFIFKEAIYIVPSYTASLQHAEKFPKFGGEMELFFPITP